MDMEAEALDIQSLALEHSCLESRYVNKLGAHNAPTLCRGLFNPLRIEKKLFGIVSAGPFG